MIKSQTYFHHYSIEIIPKKPLKLIFTSIFRKRRVVDNDSTHYSTTVIIDYENFADVSKNYSTDRDVQTGITIKNIDQYKTELIIKIQVSNNLHGMLLKLHVKFQKHFDSDAKETIPKRLSFTF